MIVKLPAMIFGQTGAAGGVGLARGGVRRGASNDAWERARGAEGHLDYQG